MNYRHGRWVPFLVLTSAVLTACAVAGNRLDATSWQLTRFRDEGGEMASLEVGTQVTAQFQADEVAGLAGCNNYSTSYSASGSSLTFGPVATTRKVCLVPLGSMKQEQAFLDALAQVQRFKILGTSLQMLDGNGETLLEFESLVQQ